MELGCQSGKPHMMVTLDQLEYFLTEICLRWYWLFESSNVGIVIDVEKPPRLASTELPRQVPTSSISVRFSGCKAIRIPIKSLKKNCQTRSTLGAAVNSGPA